MITVLLAFLLMPYYFTINSYNWWYLFLLPMTISLIMGFIHLKEEKQLHYKALYSLDLNFKRIWLVKNILGVYFLLISIGVHLVFTFCLQFFIQQRMESYRFSNLFFATLLTFLVTVWQIPFSFWMVKKLGWILGSIVHTICAVFLSVLFADSSYWMFIPFTYSARLMISVLKILPNGMPAEMRDSLLLNTNFAIPIIGSLLLGIILLNLTARKFSKEVRK